MGGRPIGGTLRDWGWTRAIASNNHSTQARRLLERLIPINTSLAETARWKRRVPRGDLYSFRTSQDEENGKEGKRQEGNQPACAGDIKRLRTTKLFIPASRQETRS